MKFTEDIESLKTRVDKKIGERDSIKKRLQQLDEDILIKEEHLENLRDSQAIMQAVAEATQREIEYFLSELVTLGMGSVFDHPYNFIVSFELKRGKTEAVLSFERDGNRIHPMDASGGGAVEIGAMCLQLSMWNLQRGKLRNLMIFDEPLSRLKGADLPTKGSLLIKEISEKLNLQVIMVSHDPALVEGADRVFSVSINEKGISSVEQLD